MHSVSDGTLFASLVAGIGIPLVRLFCKREAFFSAGGFDTSFTVMEDLELLQRIVLTGAYQATAEIVARLRMHGHELSTTNWEAGVDARYRQREKVFSLPLCCPTLRKCLRYPNTAFLRLAWRVLSRIGRQARQRIGAYDGLEPTRTGCSPVPSRNNFSRVLAGSGQWGDHLAMLDIVIPNYNGGELLRRYLPTVRNAFGPSARIVVVDDGSSDESVGLLHSEFPYVELVSRTRNAGFSAAVNDGISATAWRIRRIAQQ